MAERRKVSELIKDIISIELPDSWLWVAIGDIANTTSGGTPSRDNAAYFAGDIPWVKSGELEDGIIMQTEEQITDDAIRNSSAKVFPVGTPLVAMYGATVGKTGILGIEAATNQAVCAIFPLVDGFSSKYIKYWLLSQRDNLIKQSVGGAQPNINQGIIRAHPIPLAPLNEQRRIVEAIEALFSRLDAGIAALKRAQANLKRYKASVLKAACEGRLVPQDPDDEPASELLARILAERRAKWEAEELAKYEAKGKKPPKNWRDKYPEPQPPDTSDLPELPEGWVWVNFASVADVQGGIQKQPTRKPKNNPYPYLRVANVQRGALDLSEISEFELFEGELEKWRLEPGDLLIVEGNGSKDQIGRCAIWTGEIEDCVHQNHIIRARFSEIIPEYVGYFLNSPDGISAMIEVASSTSGLYTLSVSKVNAISFPLPPIDEQRHIVDEVERLLSVINEMQEFFAVSLKRAERLRQSILKDAFAGRLVPQDPDDEPASVLLERIRAEREQRR